MSELRPIDLDAIEDLLEGLESCDLSSLALDDPDAPELVSKRLLEYQTILRASREALPLEEVPAGILDGVLDEARRAAASPTPSARPGLWQRLRGTFLVPGLALATAAALVIIVVRPGEGEQAPESPMMAAEAKPDASDERVSKSETSVREQANEGRLADASLDRAELELDPAAEARGKGLLEPPVEEADDEVGRRADGLLKDDAPLGGVERDKSKPSTRSTTSAGATKSKSSSDAPLPKPAPASEPKKAEAPGTASGAKQGPPAEPTVETHAKTLDLADAQRRAGNCKAARFRYDQILKEAGEDASGRRLRARAHAGIGLCEMAAGNDSAAEAHFAKARAADPAVSKHIDAELARASKK